MGYVLVYNGTLIDGIGRTPIPDGCVLIKDNVIIKVGSLNSISIPASDVKKIDVHGGFILPGFIDCHVHIMFDGFKMEDPLFTPLSLYFYQAVDNMRLTLEAGVTTIRDAGMADYGVKNSIENGLITGPRIQISVMPLSITGGHFDLMMKSGIEVKTQYPGLPEAVCDGADEVRKKVREVLRAGAEFIKVMVTGGVLSANDSPEHPQFTPEELAIIVEEAAYRNVPVMAHAHGSIGIKNALKANILSIEHATCLDQECIDLLLEKDAWIVPTLLVHQFNQKENHEGNSPDYMAHDAAKIARVVTNNMKMAYKAGVNIAMGTDSGVSTHGKNLRELALLCQIGLSPMEAIQAGTHRASKLLGWEDKIGTLEKGKLADLVVSKKDPLAHIESLGDPNNISLVIKDGVVVKDIRHL